MNYDGEHPGSRARSPAPPLRTTQSMYQSPTAVPPHQPLRRIATSPPVYQPPPVYGPDPNLIYGAPAPPAPMYGSPPPYIPQYSHNTSMYFPPPAPQPQMIIPQPQMVPSYQNYDPNFQAYFGPDVQPQSAQSPIEEQRRQFENYNRNRPIQYGNQYTSRSNISSAEARALEEAIELSLTESARRGSVSQPSDSGHTSRTNSTRSNDAWDAYSIVPGSNMSPEELADEKALQEAILASIREAELEQERDSKLPDDYDEDLCILAALRDSKNMTMKESKDNTSYQKAPVVPVLAVPMERQYSYNLDSERAGVSTERTNFSMRPLPPAPSNNNRYEDREYNYRDNNVSYERSASAHRRRAEQPPAYAADNYSEQPRRVAPREEAYLSPRREYPDVDLRAALPPYESPRREYPDAEPCRSTPGYDSREGGGGLVRLAQQSAHRYQLEEEAAYDRPKLTRRNSPGMAAYEEATRRPSAGRDFAEKDDFYRSPASARDVYEAERYAAARRNVGEERRFENRAALGCDYQDTDNYPSRPYPEVRSGVTSPPQYAAEHRSTSATRLRAAPPALWEDSDIPREYHPQDPRRLASNNNLTATTKSSYYGAAPDAARARYDMYEKEKDLHVRNGPSRQTSRGSSMYLDSPRTGSEGSSAEEEEELYRMQSTSRGGPPGYDRALPPVFGRATLRAPTPPPKHSRSGVKYM